jgi:hypothetical protein
MQRMVSGMPPPCQIVLNSQVSATLKIAVAVLQGFIGLYSGSHVLNL